MSQSAVHGSKNAYIGPRSMKSKDVFNVAVRIIGLAFLYQGLAAVPMAIMNFCPVYPPTWRMLNFHSIIPSIIMVGWPLVVAFWMIRGAPWLMRLAYRDEPNTPSAPTSSAGASVPQ